jgi:hypothetical protein
MSTPAALQLLRMHACFEPGTIVGAFCDGLEVDTCCSAALRMHAFASSLVQ